MAGQRPERALRFDLHNPLDFNKENGLLQSVNRHVRRLHVFLAEAIANPELKMITCRENVFVFRSDGDFCFERLQKRTTFRTVLTRQEP